MSPRFIYRSTYWIRNSFQYVLGSIFYFLMYGSFNPLYFMLGLLGFLIAYNAVYFINDLVDFKDDKKNMINTFKPLIKKTINFDQAKTYAAVSLLVGISLSFFVSTFYGILVSSLIMLNVFHSLLRKNFRGKAINLFFIQVIKYSTGWFTLTINLTGFPLWTVFSISIVYVLVYFLYKNNVMIKSTILENKLFFSLMSGLGVASYIISVMFSPFKLPLILIFLIFPVPILLCLRFRGTFDRIKIGGISSQFIFPIFVLLFLILTIPSVAEVNEKISIPINHISSSVKNMAPVDVVNAIGEIEETVTSNLEITINNVSEISQSLYYR